MAAARAKIAELKALRAAGKKRLSTYEVEDQGDVYDEVDDEGYKKVIRNRLDQDDFVVDDNGAGYADDGREVWNEQVADYDSESDNDELPARGKAAKRKREEEQQRKEKINNGITKYFNGGAAPQAPKPKVSNFDEYPCMDRRGLMLYSRLLLQKMTPLWLDFLERLIQMSSRNTPLRRI